MEHSDGNWKGPARWISRDLVSPTLGELADALEDFAV